MAEQISINRKYKDRLFRFIFNKPEELLSLYNALNNTSYDNPDDITVNTMDNYIYMSMKNVQSDSSRRIRASCAAASAAFLCATLRRAAGYIR